MNAWKNKLKSRLLFEFVFKSRFYSLLSKWVTWLLLLIKSRWGQATTHLMQSLGKVWKMTSHNDALSGISLFPFHYSINDAPTLIVLNSFDHIPWPIIIFTWNFGSWKFYTAVHTGPVLSSFVRIFFIFFSAKKSSWIDFASIESRSCCRIALELRSIEVLRFE